MAMICRELTWLWDEWSDGFSVFVARVTVLLMSVLRPPELHHTPGALYRRCQGPEGHLQSYQKEPRFILMMIKSVLKFLS